MKHLTSLLLSALPLCAELSLVDSRWVATVGSPTLKITHAPVVYQSNAPASVSYYTDPTVLTSDDLHYQKKYANNTNDRQLAVAGFGQSITVESWVSSNPAVATVSGTGLTSRVADGSAVITATWEGGSGTYPISYSSTQTFHSNVFYGWADGSLARHATDSLETLMTAAGSGPDLLIYSTLDYTNHVYTKNTACWAASLDFSGVSVYQSFLGETNAVGQFRPLTMITPQHGIAAQHFCPLGTSQIKFRGSDGVIYTRTVGAGQTIGGTDLMVIRLSSPLPAEVRTYKVLGSDSAGKTPTVAGFVPGGVPSYFIPILGLTQEKRATVRNLYNLGAGNANSNISTLPTSGLRVPFSYELRGGDSGNPSFLLANGELVLLGCWLSAGGAPAPQKFISEINAAILALDNAVSAPTGYTVTPFDASAFNTY